LFRARGRLTFSPLAWLKLQFFLHAGDTEVGGFGVSAPGPAPGPKPAPGAPGAPGTPERPEAPGAGDNLLYVADFVTVSQRTTLASVAFDDQAVADYFERCFDQGIHPSRAARIWCHTHPGDSPQPSATDEECFARVFGACDWSVMFIISRTGQTYARLSFKAGPGASLLLPVAVDWACWPALASDAGRDLDAIFQGWVDEYVANIHPEMWDCIGATRASGVGGAFPGDDQEMMDLWEQDLTDADLAEQAAREEEEVSA
jgi:hypothetical protein